MRPTLSNPAKDRPRTGDVALGLSLRLSRSADMARIVFPDIDTVEDTGRAAGLDQVS